MAGMVALLQQGIIKWACDGCEMSAHLLHTVCPLEELGALCAHWENREVRSVRQARWWLHTRSPCPAVWGLYFKLFLCHLKCLIGGKNKKPSKKALATNIHYKK